MDIVEHGNAFNKRIVGETAEYQDLWIPLEARNSDVSRVLWERWSAVVDGLDTTSMTNTPSSVSFPAQHKILNSPMRDLVRAVLYFSYGGEATLSDVKRSIDGKFERDSLPRNWRIQVRDVLKYDPDIEKMEEDTWVLRTSGLDQQ